MSNVVKLSDKYEPLFLWLELNGREPLTEYEEKLSKVNTVCITGGRYSQKSFGVSLFAGTSADDYNHRILYTRYTMTSTEDSIIPEFTEKLDILNSSHKFKVNRNKINGIHNDSKISFKGIKTSQGNQTANLKSLKDFSMFILDEGEEMPNFDDWDKIKKSVRALDVPNLSIIMLNPTTKDHWVYREFYEPFGIRDGWNGIVGRTLYIHSTYLDIEREFIADDTWEDYEEMRKVYEWYIKLSPKEKTEAKDNDYRKVRQALNYKHVILGGWRDKAEGVIFENWKIGEFEYHSKPIFGQDFGFSVDPTTLVEVSIDKARKRIFLKECFYKTKLTTSEIADLNKKYAGDSLIYADSAEPRLIEEIRSEGLNIRATKKGVGSITAGIAIMQDYELIIEPNSTNLIKELNNYVWNDKKSSTPIDDYNHCFVGDTKIITNKGYKLLKDIEVGDLVLTSKGFKKVLKKFKNGLREVCDYSIKFRNFEVILTGTYDHKIKTSKGWKQLQSIQKKDQIYLANFLTEKNIINTKAKDIFQKAQTDFIESCGNTTMAKFLMDTISTTKTEIQAITGLTISKFSEKMSILKNIQRRCQEGHHLKSKSSTLKKLDHLQLNGMAVLKELNGIESTQKNMVSVNLNMESESVKVAQRNLKQKQSIINSAQTIASHNIEEIKDLMKCKDLACIVGLNSKQTNTQKVNIANHTVIEVVESNSRKEQVFDLMVEDCHEYFANDILVHNCVDGARYAIFNTLSVGKKRKTRTNAVR